MVKTGPDIAWFILLLVAASLLTIQCECSVLPARSSLMTAEPSTALDPTYYEALATNSPQASPEEHSLTAFIIAIPAPNIHYKGPNRAKPTGPAIAVMLTGFIQFIKARSFKETDDRKQISPNLLVEGEAQSEKHMQNGKWMHIAVAVGVVVGLAFVFIWVSGLASWYSQHRSQSPQNSVRSPWRGRSYPTACASQITPIPMPERAHLSGRNNRRSGSVDTLPMYTPSEISSFVCLQALNTDAGHPSHAVATPATVVAAPPSYSASQEGGL